MPIIATKLPNENKPDSNYDVFVLNTKNMTYAMNVINGFLNHSYWGKRVDRIEDIPVAVKYNTLNAANTDTDRQVEEYPPFGGRFYDNEALKITFPDGVRDTVLIYDSFEITDEKTTLVITLKDAYYPVKVKLFYKIYFELDLIERHTEIINECDGKITLESFYSACYTLPFVPKQRLTYMCSGWCHEYEVKHTEIEQNTILLESRGGTSLFNSAPYFAIDEFDAAENSGDVWFGTLKWSGNWQIKVGRDIAKRTRVVGGISNFDCSVPLKKGESFVTPEFLAGFSTEGFGGCNRKFHDYTRATSICEFTDKPMPVLYNAWSTFLFNIDEELLFAQAKRCADLGVELFVIDDGWMKGRKNDSGGLGDWEVDEEKFPHGLKYVVDRINELGLKFGIWVEPEAVTEDSKLYKNHPDWILHYPTREKEKQRNQFVLNFAKDEVLEYTIGWIDKLLSENNIEYLKFDMNRRFSQAGWSGEPADVQPFVYIKYVQNFYKLLEHINKKFPHVLIENCAGGALKGDLQMSEWCGRINRSDNQDPVDVLQLHEGFTKINLPKSAGGACHFHHTPHYINGRTTPMKFMAYVAYNGSLAIGLDLRRLTDDELKNLKGYVDFYKEIREITQLGDMYVLHSAYDKEGSLISFQYVSKDKKRAVILCYANNIGFKNIIPNIKPKGLKEDAVYSVNTVGNDTWGKSRDMSGKGIMNIGLVSSNGMKTFSDPAYDAFAIVLKEK